MDEVPERDVSLSGALIDGRYRVEYCIGSGGMGVVWRVRHVRSRQAFALKTLRTRATRDRKALRRILQEARAAAAIRSRHVVRVVDVKPDYVHEGTALPFIVMELLEGTSLADYLASVDRLSEGQVVWVMRAVSRGLSRAHEQGIIHRDLKPSNIFLARDDDDGVVVKLCDFGIAKLHASAHSEASEPLTLSTDTGVILGTPRYMAPEQLRQSGSERPATDQWAFALVAFRALTGRGYFEQARSMAELLLAIVHDALPKPSRVSHLGAEFDAWFERSCARDPEQRFASVEAQQRALEQALGTPEATPIAPADLQGSEAANEPGTRSASPSKEEPPRAHLRPFYVALVAATLLSLVSTIRVAAELRPRPPPLREIAQVSTVSSAPARGRAAMTPIESTSEIAKPAPAVALDDTAKAESTKPVSPEPPPKPLRRRGKPRAVSAMSPLLPLGAPCARSSECRDGLCAAEVCQ
ncbi:MAG TPA: serine/threonine-protein kinase [Polyangiaceae bacterium]|nr:serine/threonine-protein kinase [Polyangiaceae bacterium]